jgi:two-component system, NarL family, response regulator LiaR
MADSQERITVLIADDHEMTRQGIRGFLEQAPDMQIVGEAQDGEEIKRLVADLRPQILLLDLVMPNLSPAKLEKWVRENHPETITLVLTAHDRDAYLAGMMEAGAAGYLDKKLRARQLISAIRRAARGEVIFTKEQFERALHWREEVVQRWESLSKRERQILQLLTEGMENKEVAKSLSITINTVEKHLDNIYKKLGVNTRTEAVHWWDEKITDFRN